MSKLAMVFRDFVWPRLPDNISIEDARTAARLHLPYTGEAVQDLGGNGRAVTGDGVFLGAQAAAQWEALCDCFAKGGTGTLLLPGAEPIKALFASLSLTGAPRDDRVAYTFTFLEQPDNAALPASVRAQAGDCLWSIANRWKVPLEALREANPQIPWYNDIAEGTELVLP